MNSIAVVSAIIGLIIIVLVNILSNKVKNKWLKYLALILGILFAMGVVGNIPPLLGETDVTVSAKAGEFMFYGLVVLVIINAIFSKK